jgi:hypothetical protein
MYLSFVAFFARWLRTLTDACIRVFEMNCESNYIHIDQLKPLKRTIKADVHFRTVATVGRMTERSASQQAEQSAAQACRSYVKDFNQPEQVFVNV